MSIDLLGAVGNKFSLLISPSIQVTAYCTYCGPEQVIGVLLLESAQRYSNPGGKPRPASKLPTPTSHTMSQMRRISVKKSTAMTGNTQK